MIPPVVSPDFPREHAPGLCHRQGVRITKLLSYQRNCSTGVSCKAPRLASSCASPFSTLGLYLDRSDLPTLITIRSRNIETCHRYQAPLPTVLTISHTRIFGIPANKRVGPRILNARRRGDAEDGKNVKVENFSENVRRLF